jgi:hypothetical protein
MAGPARSFIFWTGVVTMLKTASTIALVPAALLVALLSASPARAQLNRTFVSGAGSDNNPCTFSSPCRTFQTAFNATSAGGEIDVLNPADYGPLTIDKALSIEGHGFAGIGSAVGQNPTGIEIRAGEKDTINLSGLIIEGTGTEFAAIKYDGGKFLTIKDCVIRNFGDYGILIEAGGTSGGFSIWDTVVSNVSPGIQVSPTGSAVVSGSITRTKVYNTTTGIAVAGIYTTGATLDVVVEDSESSGNSNAGLVSVGPSSVATSVQVRNFVASHNDIGLKSLLGGVIRVGHSVVSGNHEAVELENGTIFSYGDNNIDGNTNNGWSLLIPLTMH